MMTPMGKSIQGGQKPGDSGNMKTCQNVRKTQKFELL